MLSVDIVLFPSNSIAPVINVVLEYATVPDNAAVCVPVMISAVGYDKFKGHWCVVELQRAQ